jgi:hypothetical protein
MPTAEIIPLHCNQFTGASCWPSIGTNFPGSFPVDSDDGRIAAMEDVPSGYALPAGARQMVNSGTTSRTPRWPGSEERGRQGQPTPLRGEGRRSLSHHARRPATATASARPCPPTPALNSSCTPAGSHGASVRGPRPRGPRGRPTPKDRPPATATGPDPERRSWSSSAGRHGHRAPASVRVSTGLNQ